MSRARTLAASFGLGARVLATRVRATRPFKITLMLTERCDCRCEACFIWQKPKGKEMTPEEIAGFLSAAPSLSWINLTGGEPFLRNDIPEVVEAIVGALPRVTVLDFPTTGQRTEAILEGCARITQLNIPRFFVTCSIEGPPELHDQLRGRPGAFERLMRTYAGLKVMPGVTPYLGMTLSDRNADQVEATLEAVRDHVPDVGWRDLHLNVYTESGHYYGNEGGGLRAPASVTNAVRRALREREGSWDPTDVIEAAYLRKLPRYLETGRSPLPCQSMRAGVFVDAKGDVYPCTVWGKRLGNVLETPLYEILDADISVRARETIKKDACPGCWSPCEAHPTIVANAPGSLLRG
ncbi:MAG: radical SAM protein [Planctomycetota bacterium]|nr:radical SAM protein [Planctomycetota bacterium]